MESKQDEAKIQINGDTWLTEQQAREILHTCKSEGWRLIAEHCLKEFREDAIDRLPALRRDNFDDMLVAIGARMVVTMLDDLPSVLEKDLNEQAD